MRVVRFLPTNGSEEFADLIFLFALFDFWGCRAWHALVLVGAAKEQKLSRSAVVEIDYLF